MNFPDNVDYGAFYRQAKAKGIKVSSKYAGVFIHNRKDQGLEFISSFGASKGRVILGRFPLDKHGELMAHRRYLAHRESITIKKGRVSSKEVNPL